MLAALKNYGFYALASVAALIIVGLFAQYSVTPQSGSDNGGADMGLFSFILFPLALLSVVVLAYRFVANRFVRISATVVVILLLASIMYLFLRDGLPVAG
jgi:hypothetical protein